MTRVRARPHPDGGRIDLNWQNPQASAFAGGRRLAAIQIVRRERTFPAGPDDGTVVYPAGPVVTAFADSGVEPMHTYYYTVYAFDDASPPAAHASAGSRAIGFATADHATAARLYELLPAVHRRHDLPMDRPELESLAPPIRAALRDLPGGLRDRGQLWRFLHATAAPLDLMRSLADGLRDLHDLDRTRADYLPLLARWLDWNLDRTLPVAAQRNEIRFAPSRYRTAGTAPNLAALVTRYTEWHPQIAEFAEHIARSNDPSRLAVFGLRGDAGGWRGIDDAAPALGFRPPADESSGSAGQPARLTGATSGPFRLRPGLALAVTVDDRAPVTVRFGPSDFGDIGTATSAEVAAVLNRELGQVTATERTDGRLVLTTNSVGAGTRLRVERYATSLVSLEAAPQGALAAVEDPAGRLFLAYATADPLAVVTAAAAAQVSRGEPLPHGRTPGLPPAGKPRPAVRPSVAAGGQLRLKTFRGGSWGASVPIGGPADSDADPALVCLPDGRLWLAWTVEGTAPRFRIGVPGDPGPARVAGVTTGPFRGLAGTDLVVESGAGRHGVTFTGPSPATTAQVVQVLTDRLPGVVAAVGPADTVVLTSAGVGGDQSLRVDVPASSAAAVLGFTDAPAARGDWGDAVGWHPAEQIPDIGPGRIADLTAAIDGPGRVWLAWSQWTPLGWSVRVARWDAGTWSVPETVASSVGGDREPALLWRGGRMRLFWARRTLHPAGERWGIRGRAAEPWGAEFDVTTVPPLDKDGNVRHVGDREPAAVVVDGRIEVHFCSDRSGGPHLWRARVDPAGAPEQITTGPAAHRRPAPVRRTGDGLWLLHRSNRSLPAAQIATAPLPDADTRIVAAGRTRPSGHPPGRSFAIVDTGTLRRHAATSTARVYDAALVGNRRRWDDLLSYTPQVAEPGEADLYTRGTVGLYLSEAVPVDPLAGQKLLRLCPALRRFLPANVRVVMVLAPRLNIEFVYTPTDIQESYADDYPFVEYVDPPTDRTTVALPGWVVLLSNTAEHRTADPADRSTLRRRTFYPPPA